MIATLPMYDWPEVMADLDQFWAGLARHADYDVPLSRLNDFTGAWSRPDMIFSQTCGYPFTHHFKDKLTLVATPHYDAPGCDGPLYCSFIFAREKRELADFRGRRAAVNTPDSMSGMLALKAVFYPFAVQGQFFGEVTLSGGHLHSLQMVQEGSADVCAIDSVCVEMARRYRPELLKGLVEVARSPQVPGLPFVTIAGDMVRLRSGLTASFADPALAPCRARLLLKGFSFLERRVYDVILDLERKITAAGDLDLHGIGGS